MKCRKCGREFKIGENGKECPFCFESYTFTQNELEKLYNDALISEKKKRFTDAAAKFRVLCYEGVSMATFHYGECLEWGRGVKIDIEKALEMYARASQSCVAEAAYAYYRCVVSRKIQDEGIISEAYYRLQLAAAFDNAEAMAELARVYEEGIFLGQSLSLAVVWHIRAAENKNADSMLALSQFYFEGRGVEKNDAVARWYLQRAMQYGKKNKKLSSSLSMITAEEPLSLSAEKYSKQIFIIAHQAEKRAEYKVAFSLFEKCGALGYAKAELRTAECYSCGLGVEKNDTEALKWYERAAQHNYIDAIIALGNCYKEGRGVERNINKCLQYYQRAADLGDARAMYMLAECYFNGEIAEQDVPRAVRLYQKSALKGYAASVDRINKIFDKFAQIFNEALAAQKKGDYEQAVRLYTISAEMGHRASACNLGYCYQVGKGCKVDMHKAVYYYKIAAEDGSPAAKYNLGICYKQGGGVKLDFKRAAQLFTEVQDGGFGEQAKELLRQMKRQKEKKLARRLYSASCAVYRKGDTEEAIRLRVDAAKLGSGKAEFLLGCHFEFGDGLPLDIDKARQWYDRAREDGFIDPVNEMKQAYLREKRLIEIFNKVD